MPILMLGGEVRDDPGGRPRRVRHRHGGGADRPRRAGGSQHLVCAARRSPGARGRGRAAIVHRGASGPTAARAPSPGSAAARWTGSPASVRRPGVSGGRRRCGVSQVRCGIMIEGAGGADLGPVAAARRDGGRARVRCRCGAPIICSRWSAFRRGPASTPGRRSPRSRSMTRRIRFGPLVCPITFHHPAMHGAAGGRDRCAVRRTVRARHRRRRGTTASTRRSACRTRGSGERVRRLDEAAHVIRALWGDQPATFEGRYYPLDGAWGGPSRCSGPAPPRDRRQGAEGAGGRREARRRVEHQRDSRRPNPGAAHAARSPRAAPSGAIPRGIRYSLMCGCLDRRERRRPRAPGAQDPGVRAVARRRSRRRRCRRRCARPTGWSGRRPRSSRRSAPSPRRGSSASCCSCSTRRTWTRSTSWPSRCCRASAMSCAVRPLLRSR